MAERTPTIVWLNLGDLEKIMQALALAGADRRGRITPEARPLIAKIGRARDRRLRAVEKRAAG